MPVIDPRLLECNGEPEYTENFNRVLALIDALRSDMTTVQGVASGAVSALDVLEALTTRTVIFNSDGGTDVGTQTIVYGGMAAEPEDPIKEGYTFSGWYSGETEYSFATEVKADLTLTAHWTEA